MNDEQVLQKILNIAQKDERIRGVILNGSRSNPNIIKDEYQDFDIIYLVNDVKPFYNNLDWLENCFGKPLLLQLPEMMKHPLLPPENDGHFVYLMLFNDYRIDLSINKLPYDNQAEPAIVLLDKDKQINVKVDYTIYNINPPTEKLYQDVCNEFWWCLNNVDKGLKRNEIPYVMEMFNHYVRDMLNQMVDWYIGIQYDFKISVGKFHKYYKKYLQKDIYQKYLSTYCKGELEDIWLSVNSAVTLFSDLAHNVGNHFNYVYKEIEEVNMRKYLNKRKEK